MDEAGAMFRGGDRIGAYVIHALIGVGFMGEVYRVTHAESAQQYALKCLQVRHLGNAQLVERARREAQALTQIRHANIVYVHEAGVTDTGVVWMAMELLEGRSLRRAMKEFGRVPVPYALYYACEIADGVDAAHEHAIVHRDIKPENVFVTLENKVRVLDLGTAKFFGQDMETTGRAQVFGTVPYMSPEHLAGERVDARTDVYALGMMLYEMLAGVHPFHAYFDNVLELGRAQLFQVPKPLGEAVPGLPGFMASLVERAIAKDRELRYPSMSEFARAIRRAKLRFEQMHPESEEAFEMLKQTIPQALRSVHGRAEIPSAERSSRPSRPSQPSPAEAPLLLRSGTIRMPSAPRAETRGGPIGPYGTQVIPPDILASITAERPVQAKRETPGLTARDGVSGEGSGVHSVQQTGAGQVLSRALPASKKSSLALFLLSFSVMMILSMVFIGWWWKARTPSSNTSLNMGNSIVVDQGSALSAASEDSRAAPILEPAPPSSSSALLANESVVAPLESAKEPVAEISKPGAGGPASKVATPPKSPKPSGAPAVPAAKASAPKPKASGAPSSTLKITPIFEF